MVTYGVTQRFFGRYEPRGGAADSIEELTPTADDLGSYRSEDPLDSTANFGVAAAGGGYQRLRSGSARELAAFKLSQSFDLIEAQEDLPPGETPFSDVNADMLLFPNDYVILRGRADYNAERNRFSDYTAEAQLEDKRTDRLRTRLRFVDGQFRQLESNFEIRLSESFRFGYYNRYDDLDNQLIEQKVGMRYLSQCKCWIADIDFTDRINPDETKISFNITLFGLGEINQRFFPTMHDKADQSK